jgi:hypothetical protein
VAVRVTCKTNIDACTKAFLAFFWFGHRQRVAFAPGVYPIAGTQLTLATFLPPAGFWRLF